MSVIIDFLLGFVDILISLVKLVFTLVDSVIWLVLNLPQFAAGITSSLAYCPSFLMPFLLVSLAILLVFAIIKLL